jgi:hypothetical protein
MKRRYIILLILIITAESSSLKGQSPRPPSINLSGQIYDEYDHVLGWISKQGIVQDATDDRIAVIDKDGNAYDGKGQRIGKMNKNGAFVDARGTLLFTVTEPQDQQCRLIDRNGKIVGMVDVHFRNQASAIHCLYSKMRIF